LFTRIGFLVYTARFYLLSVIFINALLCSLTFLVLLRVVFTGVVYGFIHGFHIHDFIYSCFLCYFKGLCVSVLRYTSSINHSEAGTQIVSYLGSVSFMVHHSFSHENPLFLLSAFRGTNPLIFEFLYWYSHFMNIHSCVYTHGILLLYISGKSSRRLLVCSGGCTKF